jgi:hypothetical protein
MKKIFYFTIAVITFNFSYSQNCIDFKLSKQFIFEIYFESLDNCDLGKAKIIIDVFLKKNKLKIESIKINSESILKSESFKNCTTNKQYIDKINSIIKNYDRDFGDLVIADFNFDGQEDIAIKKEEGGNGGPLYNYYIQIENYKFQLDDYLSKEMETFPYFFDTKKMELKVNKRIDSTKYQIIIFKYNSKNKTWSIDSTFEYLN